jgi:hypothetical protein
VTIWGATAEVLIAFGGTTAAWRAVSSTASAATPARGATLRPKPADSPPDLLIAERAAAARNAGDVHTRLRPIVREIVEEHFAARGLQIEDARPLLDDAVWDLVRADRRAPDEPFAPGLADRDVAALLDQLEAL